MTYDAARDVAYARRRVARVGWEDRCIVAVRSMGGEEIVLLTLADGRWIRGKWYPSLEDEAAVWRLV
jgi:hypothetical protein